MPSPSAFGGGLDRPHGPRCECGRLVKTAAITTYRSAERRYVNYRCECGEEWTDALEVADRSERVSADEVLSVHERLMGWDGSLLELLEVRPDV